MAVAATTPPLLSFPIQLQHVNHSVSDILPKEVAVVCEAGPWYGDQTRFATGTNLSHSMNRFEVV